VDNEDSTQIEEESVLAEHGEVGETVSKTTEVTLFTGSGKRVGELSVVGFSEGVFSGEGGNGSHVTDGFRNETTGFFVSLIVQESELLVESGLEVGTDEKKRTVAKSNQTQSPARSDGDNQTADEG